jgi:uncharacterized membrane protein YhaH (DUF805 family)
MTRNAYKPPEAHVDDCVEASRVVAYEPEDAGYFFSARGRLGRKEFWVNGVSSALLSIVIFQFLAALLHAPWLAAAGKVLITWSSTVIVARRAHDFGSSGWWAALYAVVLVASEPVALGVGASSVYAWLATLFVLLAFGVFPGDLSSNQYGLPQGTNGQRAQAV